MTTHELKEFAKAIKGFYPEATLAQAVLVAETAAQMPFQRAVAVLKTHARLHEFFSIPQITAGLQADNEKIKTMRRDAIKERVVDWLRRSDPFTYNGESDLAALQKHFRAAAEEVGRKCDDQRGRDRALKMILSHGRAALHEIGFDDVGAEELAREWAGLAKEGVAAC